MCIVFYCSKVYLKHYQVFYKNIAIQCIKNFEYFDIETYKGTFDWMWTYRSLNTYCRTNINKILKGTLLRYIQNDKISFQMFLEKHGFKHSECIYKSRCFDKIEMLKAIQKHINNSELIIKPSHLSFSEGVCFVKDYQDIEAVDSLLQIYENGSCSLTEGSYITDYPCKRGVIIQKMLCSDTYLLNEWKIMYIWGVPIMIHWKVDHTKKYAVMLSDFTLLQKNNIQNVCDIPEFWKEMFDEGSRLCKLIGIPFLRVDFLWSEKEYIVNECEILPSNYMLFPFEFMIMELLKIPYADSNRRRHIFYEAWSYIYYAVHFIEYYVRSRMKYGLYSHHKI